MIYADVALNSVMVAIILDLYILRSQMMTRKIFWKTYFLILPFQLLTNWWLTSKNIVMYSEGEIIGTRVAGAPLEDLLFGFSMMYTSPLLVETATSPLGKSAKPPTSKTKPSGAGIRAIL